MMEYDIFISHATEDKEVVARPLAEALQAVGLRVWLDEYELTLGDSLRRTIDRGLAASKYGVVILSPSFFQKEWPQKELDGLVARESHNAKVILPVWHKVDYETVLGYSPTLADKLSISTDSGIEAIVKSIMDAIAKENQSTQLLDQGASSSSQAASILKFVVEGARVSGDEIQLIFSLWNHSTSPVKVIEFKFEEYARINSVDYFGGPRSILRISKAKPSTLWDGRTEEIPPQESASFDLRCTVITGPADSSPWVVIGICARYHNQTGVVRTLPSDALFLYSEGRVNSITEDRLSSLKSVADCPDIYSTGTVDRWAEFIHRMVAQAFVIHLSKKETGQAR